MSKIGIWMDHYTAHCIVAEKGVVATLKNQHASRSRHVAEEVDETQVTPKRAGNNEYKMNQIEKNALIAFFHSLADYVHEYQHILLFGPTTAKQEFFNTIMEDIRFNGKTLYMENSDKLTDNQMVAFVREFYAYVK